MRREVKKAVQAHTAPKPGRAVTVKVAKLHCHAVTAGSAKLALDMFNEAPPPLDLSRL